jgi:hypothetical protein
MHVASSYNMWLHQHREEREGAEDAQSGPGGGGTEAKGRQQKVRNDMQHPIYF